MNNLKYGLILLMVTSSFHILAQTTSAQKLKDISIVEVMEKAIFSEDDTLSFENYRVNDPVNDQDTISDGDSFLYYLLLQKHKSKLKLDSVDRIIVPAVLYFGHCQFDNLVCSHFAFREITFFKCEIRDQNNDYDEEFDKSAMVFFDCTFSSNLSIDNVTVENLLIDNTEFKADVKIFNSKIGQHSPDSSCVFTHCSFRANTEIDNNNLGSLVLSKCSFYNYTSITGNSGFEDQYLNISLDSINFFEIKNTVKAKTSVSWLKEFSPVNQFDFGRNKRSGSLLSHCKFYSKNPHQYITFYGADEDSRLQLRHTTVQSALILNGEMSELTLKDVQISGTVNLMDFRFPEENTYTWSDIKGAGFFSNYIELGTLRVPAKDSAAFLNQLQGDILTFPYYAKTSDELSNEYCFNGLHASLYRLYQVFKSNGDLKSSNQCYVYIKDLEGDYLYNQLKDDFSIKTLISLSLNRLIKAYTSHGTDPAKAILVSIYIILFFSFIYFAFPSDWNGNLEFNFIEMRRSLFSRSNEKTNFKNLFSRTKMLLSGWFHSFMLSVNSFVTLGFGDIPAKGFVRNLCIIEGFIGWFLLSIFVVALINQTLF